MCGAFDVATVLVVTAAAAAVAAAIKGDSTQEEEEEEDGERACFIFFFRGCIAMLTVTLLLLFFLSLKVATVSKVAILPVLFEMDKLLSQDPVAPSLALQGMDANGRCTAAAAVLGHFVEDFEGCCHYFYEVLLDFKEFHRVACYCGRLKFSAVTLRLKVSRPSMPTIIAT